MLGYIYITTYVQWKNGGLVAESETPGPVWVAAEAGHETIGGGGQ